eukprot:2545830-Ditylum_brightwellii.AAC.1
MYSNPPSVPRNLTIEINNHKVVDIVAEKTIITEESIEVGESINTGSDDENVNTNAEDEEPVHEEKVEKCKDGDDQGQWQKSTITRSGRVSDHGIRFADEQWSMEQGNIGIPKAEVNYYAILQQPCDDKEENMNEIGC